LCGAGALAREKPTAKVNVVKSTSKAAGEGARATRDMQILETERLLLREFVPGDAHALASVISDPGTMRFYPETPDRLESNHGLNVTGGAIGMTVMDSGPWS
jgi:hypothetical protein